MCHLPGVPAARGAADLPAREASHHAKGAASHPSRLVPRMLAVLPSPLVLQLGQCRAAAPCGPGQPETVGRIPQTHPAPQSLPQALDWPLLGSGPGDGLLGPSLYLYPVPIDTGEAFVLLSAPAAAGPVAPPAPTLWAPSHHPGAAGSSRSFASGWLLAVQREPGMCRALVIQSVVLAENMFTTFPLLQHCPFQPAH